MKFTKIYFDREFFAEKLGVDANQIAITDVSNQLHELNVTIAIDNDATTKGELQASELGYAENLRRFRLKENKLEDKLKQLINERDVINATYMDEAPLRSDWQNVIAKIDIIKELLN